MPVAGSPGPKIDRPYLWAMRLFVLAPALLACFVLHAQPTIGTADLPQGGTVYLRANAVPPFNAYDIDNNGEDVTWNFSDLISTSDQETEYFYGIRELRSCSPPRTTSPP